MPEVEVHGTRLHYDEAGSGEPALLLLHAFPLHSGMWAAQVDALSPRYRVVTPDLKGFGRSDAPEDRAAYTMDAYADEVAGLLDHLGLDRVVVGGLSMGGYVAFALLSRHRDRVGGLVLADTRPGPDTKEAAERRTRQQQQVAEGDVAGVVETLLGGLLGETTRSQRPELVERVRGLMDNPPAGYIGALEAMKARPDSTSLLASIDVPTLVVVGEQDSLSTPDVMRDMQEQIPRSRLVVLPEAAHLSNLEAPEDFNRAVGDFLDEC